MAFPSRHRASGAGVAQGADPVVVTEHALVLALDHLVDLRRQRFFQRRLVTLLGDILAALAFVEHRLFVLAGDQ